MSTDLLTCTLSLSADIHMSSHHGWCTRGWLQPTCTTLTQWRSQCSVIGHVGKWDYAHPLSALL